MKHSLKTQLDRTVIVNRTEPYQLKRNKRLQKMCQKKWLPHGLQRKGAAKPTGF